MKKNIFAVMVFVLLAFFVVSCSAQKSTNKKYFGVGMGVIGIINNDKIQFYQQKNNSWVTDPNDDFTL